MSTGLLHSPVFHLPFSHFSPKIIRYGGKNVTVELIEPWRPIHNHQPADPLRRRRKRSRIDQKLLDGYFSDSFTGFLVAEEVKALVGTLRITVEELVLQLLPRAAAMAIAPVSGSRVGAICRGDSGSLYFGANIEFVGEALSSTIHAEQAAIVNALAKGETGLKALSVKSPPCGFCRQFMKELNSASELKIQVSDQAPVLLGDLMPNGFGPEDLRVENRLMDPQSHELQLETPSSDALAQKALEAACSSYAPYTHCYAGVALETQSGETVLGSTYENAAFNPSLPPLHSALVNLVVAGKSSRDISKAVLVQVGTSKIDLVEATRRLLKSVSDVPLTVEYASVLST
ncbi:MAG: cytidine deaminase [Proteobacteria bacterium]|nr:cytidine deaminase [Pseudomonadota bacterium]